MNDVLEMGFADDYIYGKIHEKRMRKETREIISERLYGIDFDTKLEMMKEEMKGPEPLSRIAALHALVFFNGILIIAIGMVLYLLMARDGIYLW